MISLITLGLFLCTPSLRLFPPSSTSLPGCPLSSASPLRPSSATTAVSSITHLPFLLPLSGCSAAYVLSVYLSSERQGRADDSHDERRRAHQPLCPHASGPRASTPSPTCLTAFRPLLLLLPLHTTPSSVPLLATTTFGSSGVRVTLTPPPLLLTSWRPARLVV